MAVVQNVSLGTLSDEIHLDAGIDAGSTLCVVPPIFARQLGFDYSNRLEGGPVNVTGGGTVEMDVHNLEWVRVGSAKAYDVRIGVQKPSRDPALEKCSSASPLSSSFGPSSSSNKTACSFVPERKRLAFLLVRTRPTRRQAKGALQNPSTASG